MFDALTNKLNGVFRSLSGRGRITEANVSDAMRQVRQALLEADVNYQVAKQFCKDVQQAAMGAEVIKSLHPGQLMIKIVNDELTRLMGPVDPKVYYVSPGPTIIMMAGLQGSGKTTTAAKLAKMIAEKDKKRPLLVADDLQRPAAIDQLCTLGMQIGVDVYKEDGVRDAVQVAKNGLKHAKAGGYDAVILDTAGRLHVDEEMMNEIAAVAKAVSPHQIYLVCDAMTGQDAVNSAKEFNERLELDGVILTKLDGDARGGAALSVKAVTGKPIKFVGMGEKLDNLEPFHPDRMASRILGMGDVVTLVEKAQQQFDAEQAQKMQVKMAKGTFGFDDFLKQMQMLRKMGGLSSMLKLLPGMGGIGNLELDDREINKIEGIVHSMTLQERSNPDIIDSSRRRRIARGCGRDVQEVAGLIKTFMRSRDMMKMLAGGGGGMTALKSLFSGKTDVISAMNSMKKVKQRSKRKRPPRRKRR
ncbi:MAG TPA: signal recognition particle protein [Anaerohalosphaeraceae bacterium]|nr:signal recognition particle protein [Anaerohalosphaeraceae bacterium]HOL32738.1 signal recognition particle protein [Anaerohalosphaeraceae bacterium]HOM76700.1 signal recognition particle protein [Anaerohalosphaeraceae bacterium]HPC65314.1 signal recognition particle protein [Anaerohalosphaeraceae bacterium]HPO70062.1 signal recognition particle protein [Anaerohalosphaeraceae bacterium]